jgi:hypothetical protein
MRRRPRAGVDVDAALLIAALMLLLVGLGGVPVPRGTAERQRRLWSRYLDELQRWK